MIEKDIDNCVFEFLVNLNILRINGQININS